MKWEKVKLGKYVEILSGFAFKSKDFLNCGVPVIKIKNITQEGVTLEDVSYISKELADKNEKYHLNYNDILIALTGSHINQMSSVVGRIARIKYHEDSLLNQRVGKVFAKDSKLCDIDYVYYFLSQDYIKISLASKAGGAANQANISPNDVKSLTVRWPDIETQHRIADILSAYDDLIENNQKQIKLLEEAAQRLYKEWFVDLRFPGHENTEIVDGVPEGWIKEEIGKIIKKVHRTKQIVASEYKDEGSIPIVDQSRSFVAGYTNDLEARVDFGIPIIVFGDHTRIVKLIQFPFAKGADGTQLIISDCLEMPQRLLYCSIMNVDLSNYHYARHFKYLKEEKIMIPTVKVANEFENNVTGIFSKIQKCRDEIIRCQKTRDLLLPKLMSGEVEV